MGDYVVRTQVLDVSSYRHGIVTAQLFIGGELLYVNHLSKPKIREQLIDIKNRIDEMQSDGMPIIELVGRGGVLKKCFSNIIVGPNDQLKIIDASLLEVDSIGQIASPMKLFFPLIKWRQNYLFKKFLTY